MDCAKFGNLVEAYEAIRRDILTHDGRIIGEKVAYQIERPRYIINQELAERFSELDFSQVSAGQAPYIAPQEESDRFYNQLKTDGVKDKNLIKVGTYPTTQVGNPTLPSFNPLNLLLGQVNGSASDADPLLVDDNLGNTKRYIKNLIEQAAISHGHDSMEAYLATWPPHKDYVAVFDDYDKAIEFFENTNHGKTLPKYIQTADGKKCDLITSETFGDAISAELSIRNIRTNLILIEVLFIIVAAIIATLTFAHIIDQDAKIISLYRANGATGMQVRLVYLVYFLLLSCLTILFAIMMGLILSGVLSLINQTALQEVFTLGFGEAPTSWLWLVGWNNLIWYVIAVMLAAVVIAIIISSRQFQSRKLAKLMK